MERKRLDAFVDLTENLRKILLASDFTINNFNDNYPDETAEDELTRKDITLMLSELKEQIEYSIQELDYVIDEADNSGILNTIQQILNKK